MEYVIVVEPSYFNNGLAMIYRPPSPDIDQTHVRPNGLGLANGALAPDSPRCAASHLAVVLSRSTPLGMGVVLRL